MIPPPNSIPADQMTGLCAPEPIYSLPLFWLMGLPDLGTTNLNHNHTSAGWQKKVRYAEGELDHEKTHQTTEWTKNLGWNIVVY